MTSTMHSQNTFALYQGASIHLFKSSKPLRTRTQKVKAVVGELARDLKILMQLQKWAKMIGNFAALH
jgi:hypothetical protein